MEEEKEEWRPVVGYEGLYEVSSFGRVKSLKFAKQAILNNASTNNRYPKVNLRKSNINRTLNVHSIVACAFLGHVSSGHLVVVDHINGRRNDNRTTNLRLVTNRENVTVCYRDYSHPLSSKYAGVSWCTRNKKWHSKIVINGKRIHAGYFDVEIEAHLAYQDKLNKYKQSLNIV